MTDFERALRLKEKLSNFINGSAEIVDDIYYKQERKYFIDYYPQKIPIFIRECRNWNDFANRFEPDDYYQFGYNNFIDNEFLELLDFLEFGENIQSKKQNLENSVENSLSIILEKELFEHIQRYLKVKNYYHAIEESYKFVREKLRKITGEEVAQKAFNEKNYIDIFGKKVGETQAEKDFFEGIKYLNFAVQFLRNEKVHLLADEIDKNTAFQYIILANLAYQLINKK